MSSCTSAGGAGGGAASASCCRRSRLTTFTMKKNGDVYIKGNNILVDGTGKVSIKATSDVVVKGSKIANN